MEQLESYIEQAKELVLVYGTQFLMALAVLLIGLWVITRFTRFLQASMFNKLPDQTLGSFLASGINIVLKVLLVISVASMVGIETTSFVAILGAAGLAVGLALQGSLSNFAGGVMVLIFRPFKVGDYLEAQSLEGFVKDIGIFVTTLETFDKRIVVIPNGPLANGNLINHTASDIRAVESSIGVAYSDDIYKAKAALEAVIQQDERVLQNEGNVVAVVNLGDSSIDFMVRAFVKTDDYWGFYFDILPRLKTAVEEAGCSIPFPQRDVHLYQDK
ncbi:MAG: mechanosensitive ion channel family protein [Pseudomonadales bacterium]